MTTQDIELLRTAIRDLKQVIAYDNGLYREFCPHVLGRKNGVWGVLVWQFAGDSSRPNSLPSWRHFELRDLTQITLRDGEWHRGWVKYAPDPSRHFDHVDSVVDPAHAAEIRGTSTPRIPPRGFPRPGQQRSKR